MSNIRQQTIQSLIQNKILKLKGNGLLIHHWDTDGICSAALLLKRLHQCTITNETPTLGNYFLTEHELSDYSKYDFVLVADMALPKDQILTLSAHAPVFIFDHHLQDIISEVNHYNPISLGEKPTEYPSASWIVNQLLQNPVNLFALLGIVGDHEHNIKNNAAFFSLITEFCTQHTLTFDDLMMMVSLLDANYKLGEKQVVEDAPHYLLAHSSPQDILINRRWKNNLEKLQTEIQKILKTPPEHTHDLLIKNIHTPYNIISTITRKIFWDSGVDTIVINTGFFPDKDQLYVRSKKNMQPMIVQGRKLGYKAGGKQEVLGAIIPKEHTQEFLTEIITFLTSKHQRK